MQLLKKCLAECLGTFVLVLFGCGTACVLNCTASVPNEAYFMTALAFGLVIVAMAYSIGNISGCHINPAVSIAMLVSKKMTPKEFCAYVASQFIGAIIGGALLLAFFGSESGLGTNALYDNNIWSSMLIEVILTFVFVIAILGVTSKTSNGAVAGIVIGLTLTLVHVFGIHFTGTSVNPARSFGPAIFAGGAAFTNVWVFILAPLVGGVLAAVVYGFLAKGSEEEKEEDAAPAVKSTSSYAPRPKTAGKKKRK